MASYTPELELGDLLLEQLTLGERIILRVLRDYPDISSSMIGIHVRPTIGPLWKKILDHLVQERAVVNFAKERPNGTQYFVYRIASPEVAAMLAEESE